MQGGVVAPWVMFSGYVFTGRSTTDLQFLGQPMYRAQCVSSVDDKRCTGTMLYVLATKYNLLLVMEHRNSSHHVLCRNMIEQCLSEPLGDTQNVNQSCPIEDQANKQDNTVQAVSPDDDNFEDHPEMIQWVSDDEDDGKHVA